MNTDVLKIVAFGLACLVGIGMFFVHRRRWQWPAFEAAFAYIIVNLVLVFYILSRPLDPRWSAGKAATVNAPDLPNGPVVDIVTNPLSDFFGGVTGNVNALVNTGATALDFLVLTAYGLVVAIVLFIFAKIRDQRQQSKLFERVRRLEDLMGIKTK
jgi:hypothetical protein